MTARRRIRQAFWGAALVAALAAPTFARSVPRAATQWVERAREAASRDAHRIAISDYHKAVQADSSLAGEIAGELGDQYTWAEKPDSAIAWYRIRLRHHPGDIEAEIGIARALSWADRHQESLRHYRRILAAAPERYRPRLMVAIAQVTSWQDRHEDAVAIYDSVLADEPDYLEARMGRAQSINWSGRHREAAALYGELLDDNPDNGEIRSGLAEAYNWMGRPDLAMDVLEGESPRASQPEVAGAIHRGRAPGLGYTYRENEDSDLIERRINEFRGSFSPAYLTRGHALYAHWKISQPTQPQISRDRLGAHLEQRFSNQLALSALVGYEWNSFDRGRLGPEAFWQDHFDLFYADAYLTLTPRDWVRADFGLYRGSIENPEPIFRGIAVTEFSAGVDYRFRPTMMTAGSASYSNYSDGNARTALSGRFVWTPVQQAPVGPSNRFELTTYVGYLSFAEQLDHGYYEPPHYVIVYERVAWRVNFADVVETMIAGQVGPEREEGDWFWTGAVDGYVSWRVVPDLSLTLGYTNTRSRLDTRSGYQADGWYLSVGYLFAR